MEFAIRTEIKDGWRHHPQYAEPVGHTEGVSALSGTCQWHGGLC